MALANTAHGGTATSATAATTVSVTISAVAGETIVVAVGTVGTTSNAPTDNKAGGSNVYTQISTSVTNTETITFWATRNTSAGVTSVTCTFGSSRYGVAIATYTGVNGFSTTNKITATGSVSPATITLGTAVGSGNWTLAAFTNKGTATWSANTGNLRNNVAGAGTTTPGVAIVDNTTTTAAATESAGNVWAGTAVELLSTLSQTLSETVTITDVIVKAPVRSLAVEGVTITDTMWRCPAKTLTDTFAVLDGGGRKQFTRGVTIDHTKCGLSDSSNFTVLVSVTDNALKLAPVGSVQNVNGYDIIFTSDSFGASLLTWEVESYDSTNGVLVAWVLLPTVSHTVDTVFYLSYGNAALTTFQGGATGAAWDSNSTAIYHLDDNAANTTVVDSMGVYNGTNVANTSTKTTTGKISAGLSYNGTTDRTNCGNITQLNATAHFTMSCWLKVTTFTGWAGNTFAGVVMKEADPGGGDTLRSGIGIGTDGSLLMLVGNGSNTGAQTGISVVDTAWHHVAGVYDGTLVTNADRVKVFVDGIRIATPSIFGTIPATTHSAADSFFLADEPQQNRFLPCTMDEAHVSSASRDVAWLLTEFNNQSSPSTFLTLSALPRLSVASTKALTESTTISDVIARTFTGIRTLAETVTISDVLLKSAVVSLLDTITMSDAMQAFRQFLRTLTETLTITDVVAKAPAKVLAESAVITDAVTKAPAKTLAESATISDAIKKSAAKTLPDTITVTDVVTKAAAKILPDAITISDSVSKAASKRLSETATFTDALSTAAQLVRTLSEQITITDSLSRQPSKSLAESVSFTDSITRSLQAVRTLLETVSLVDTVTPVTRVAHDYVQECLETLSFLDTLNNSPTKTLSDEVAITDALSRMLGAVRVLAEQIAITDSVSKAPGKTLAEQFTVTDVFSRVLHAVRTFSEHFTLTALVTKIKNGGGKITRFGGWLGGW